MLASVEVAWESSQGNQSEGRIYIYVCESGAWGFVNHSFAHFDDKVKLGRLFQHFYFILFLYFHAI